jgi:biopolymer transport protein ExbB
MVANSSLMRQLLMFFALAGVLLLAGQAILSVAPAQEPAGPSGEDVGPAPFTGDAAAPETAAPASASAPARGEEINVFKLLLSGGFFMIPLGILSIIVVTFSIERALGLRKSRLMPQELVGALGRLSGAGGFDPRKAYRLCQEYPSATANVIRAMLLKVGRPHSEVEHTVQEASQREAERLYGNVRWLTMSAAVAPLIGLLGTVWGMIKAFHETSKLAVGQNKAEVLAEGIYVALVTTLTGLCIAIPAAMIAHYFEGRIQAVFHQIDELMFNLLPQIERYEGRVRFSRPGGESEPPPAEPASPAPPPAESRRAAAPAPK